MMNNNKLGRHIDDFVSDFLPIWYCSFCAIAFYVFPENNLAPKHGITMSLYYALLGLYVSILPVLLIQFLKGKAKKIAFGILWGLGLLNVAVDVTVVETTGALFSIEHVFLILGSNISESAEFFESYFDIGLVYKLIAFEASCVLVWFISRSCLKGVVSKLAALGVLLLTLVAGIFSNVLKSESWSNVFFGKTSLFYWYSPAEDLRPFRQVPEIELTEEYIAPKNIYVIIGESFSKSHSSLYGYDKLTNPLLASLPEERFYVFKNVNAADIYTTHSIKQMLTTYDSSGVQTKEEWYEHLFIFDIAKVIGYNTTWISNQAKSGIYDNIVSRLAELADTQIWAGTESLGSFKTDYDEVLIPILKDYVASYKNGDDCRLCFIHMMGSHPLYAARYPANYTVFTSEDYPNALDNQKQVLSEYDNSVLYNDFVVHSIIDGVADQDCVVLYMSDHAQDIFQSSPDFCGHAMDSNPESAHWGKQVPMMLYISDSYAARNPEFLLKAKEAQSNEYNLKDLVYSMADIMGAVTINGEAVRDKSVFKQ